jgi:hypothetical protein
MLGPLVVWAQSKKPPIWVPRPISLCF